VNKKLLIKFAMINTNYTNMDYKVQFSGSSENVSKAKLAMKDFNSILSSPKDFRVNKLDAKINDKRVQKATAIIEDYFYYLLSERGDISKEQGEKSLQRYKNEIEGIDENLANCYRYLSEWMLEDYDRYGACTLEAWRLKYWGVREQPKVLLRDNGEITLCGAQKFPQQIIDAVCALYDVTAHVIE